jgi:hypothetical protein
MDWCRKISTDSSVRYTDWVADGWLCAEGFDEAERKLGRPFALFAVGKGRHLLIACFATLSEAQRAAEEF